VFIERGESAPQAQPPPHEQSQQQTYFWYFCPGANAYYPYVRECPGGWQRVAPQPPS